MRTSFDVAVAGGGIVGAACAHACAAAGLQSSLVVEPGPIGGGATAAGMGHIVVMDDSEAQFALSRYSQQLWIELRPEAPAAVEWHACGTLWVADDEEEFAEVQRKRSHLPGTGCVRTPSTQPRSPRRSRTCVPALQEVCFNPTIASSTRPPRHRGCYGVRARNSGRRSGERSACRFRSLGRRRRLSAGGLSSLRESARRGCCAVFLCARAKVIWPSPTAIRDSCATSSSNSDTAQRGG